MKVYRLETKERFGVFSTGAVTHYMAKDQQGKSPFMHYSPFTDPGIEGFNTYDKEWQEYYCAFKNLTQLLDWFPCEQGRLEMQRYGILLNVYKTHDCIIGASQVLFRMKAAEKVKTIDLVRFTTNKG